MKKLVLSSVILILGSISISMGQDPGWPRQKSNAGGRLVYYQPQVDSWNDHRDLQFRMAFSLTPTGGKAVVGVMNVQATTDVSVDDHTVVLTNPIITDTHFPSLDSATASQMDQLVRSFVPPSLSTIISLDRLVASVDKSKLAPATVEVRNDPPAIFVSYRPAILLQVDGQPVLAEIPKTKLKFVVNTNWPLFLDTSKSNYYLFNGSQWMVGTDLQGPWTATANLPKEITKLPQDSKWAQLKKTIPAPPVGGSPIPSVLYSTSPAEVLLFQGQPVYARIPGTQLVYASNTDADLFVYGPTNQYFYLAAGRWFSSSSLQGPWVYATAKLPADFANIPPASPAGRVLVSVPGTEQAKDAVLLAQIPTTVVVNPATAAAQAQVSYYGAPEFKPIEGTSMSYATNTSDKVIKVGDVYYLCLQGIWFNSANAQGPWTTATSVPSAIYTIPPSSPVYNVTYVTQSTTSDGNVQASYTAGYVGSFIVGAAVGAIIAGGTGYYYPPYFYYPAFGYPIYHPYAATYGYGSYYNSYTGAYGVARGVYGPYGGAAGYASYNPYTGTYARGATAYGPYGSASAGRAYNPYTGTYARGASVSTPYGTRSAAQAYNPYTGTGAATRQGSSAYGQWGSSVVSRGNQAVQTGHVTTSQGTVAGARSTSGAKAIGGSGAYGSAGAVKTAGGDMYAGANGNVYKNTGGSWQKYDNGSWNSVTKPSGDSSFNRTSTAARPQMSSSDFQGMNQEFQNRQRGAAQSQSFQNFQRSGDAFGGGGGFGGRFGGGGGGFGGGRFGGGGGGRFGGRR